MSFEAQAWASQANIGQPSAKLVLLMLAYHHNGQTGQCNPSLPQLAEDTGLSRASVARALKGLIEGHWLFSLGRVHGKSNWYIFHPDSKASLPVDSLAMRQSHQLTVSPRYQDSLTVRLPTVSPRYQDSLTVRPKQGKNKEVEQGKNKEGPVAPQVDTERVKVTAGIYRQAEDLVGLLTPTLSQKIGDAIDQYSAPWILDALSEAENANVRKWSYVEAILKRWAKEGKSNGVHQSHSRAPSALRQVGEHNFSAAKEVVRRQQDRERADRGPPG